MNNWKAIFFMEKNGKLVFDTNWVFIFIGAIVTVLALVATICYKQPYGWIIFGGASIFTLFPVLKKLRVF